MRFVLLDALRGLAALFVLIRHTGTFWQFGFYRSYLAVDLFFILSGFVIAFAYDEKLRTGALSLREFFVIRLIRMYPVYLLSLGLCVVLWFNQLPELAVPFALALVFLPWPVGNQPFLFGLNGPYWSLAFELAANFLYGVLRPVLTTWVLTAVLVLSGAGVVATAFLYGNLDTGWQWTLPSAGAGLARAVFGVFLGVLLYRHHARLSALVGRFVSPWVGFLLVGVALASPSLDGFNPVIDVLVVAAVFPALVVACSRYAPRRGQRLLMVLGAASYPLYVTHQQAGALIQAVTGSLAWVYAPWSGLVFALALVLVSAGIEKLVDLPVRRWLRKRLV